MRNSAESRLFYTMIRNYLTDFLPNTIPGATADNKLYKIQNLLIEKKGYSFLCPRRLYLFSVYSCGRSDEIRTRGLLSPIKSQRDFLFREKYRFTC